MKNVFDRKPPALCYPFLSKLSFQCVPDEVIRETLREGTMPMAVNKASTLH